MFTRLTAAALALLCLTAGLATAGSRGYNLAFVDVSAPAFADGMETLLALRKAARVDGKTACWTCEHRDEPTTGIAVLYLKKLPAGVNAQSVKAALLQNGAHLSALQQRLRNFADDDGTRLDGLYAYDRGQSTVTVYAISPREGSRAVKLTLKAAGNIDPAALDTLLEKLAKQLPFVP